MKLANKTAVVTGAASGIGQAIALLFASEGATVYAFDIDEAGLKETEAKAPYGAKLTTAVVDVTQADQVRDALERVAQEAGRLDILVNNAGIGIAATVDETDEDDWDRLMAVNLRGVFLGCKYAVRIMKRQGGGVIINMASVAGIVGVKNRAAYSASKAGVYGLTKAMAVDHAADGIRVNCICPGTVDSPWIGKIIAGQPDPDAVRKSMEARQLLGRMGTPEEIAHAALYLAQDESAFVHGTALIIDGGLTAQ
jgi:meso-butanediol dehydrogenase / (S,S)-butanediol dehydrogenase / diacetyl reductase